LPALSDDRDAPASQLGGGGLLSFWGGTQRVSVGETVGIDVSDGAKCWSEWQDLNLRPPSPERGGIVAPFEKGGATQAAASVSQQNRSYAAWTALLP
jgi:hypothetical protein